MAQPSPVPVRFPSGVSTDFPYGPLANFGQINPFGYHVHQDDFNVLLTGYTATKTGAGAIAPVAGDGGLLLFTTAALATDNCVLNLPVAGFALVSGKKAFFLARLQLSSAVNAAFRVGLINTTTTPFTGGSITDGVYLDKATGSAANLTVVSVVGGVATTKVVPTNAYTLANATNLDLGFAVDRGGNVAIFVGAQLVGWLPQSGTGAAVPVRGPVASFQPGLTAAVLNPTLAVLSGAAAAATMTVDFVLAAVER